MGWTKIKLGLIGLVVLAGIACCVSKIVDNSGTDLTYDAKRVCRDFVDKRLKAPTTADYSGETVQSSGDLYTVTGDVDADNSFGAKIRNSYTCVVRSSGDQWLLISISGLS